MADPRRLVLIEPSSREPKAIAHALLQLRCYRAVVDGDAAALRDALAAEGITVLDAGAADPLAFCRGLAPGATAVILSPGDPRAEALRHAATTACVAVVRR